MVCALGAGDQLVGLSHECDYPGEVLDLPRVTRPGLDPDLPGLNIDAEVRRLREAGQPVIAVDAPTLAALRPDLLITQDLCQVCAVSDGEVHRLSTSLDPVPQILPLRARDLGGIWSDILSLGSALDRAKAAEILVNGLKHQVQALRSRASSAKPRAVCIEWLDPLFLAGHWVPEMIENAGGEDAGAAPGSRSVESPWEDLLRLDPEVVIVMLCGFSLGRALKEIASVADTHPFRSLRCPVRVMDGNAFTSRGGPRVVTGIEILHHALHGLPHPDLFTLSNPYVNVHGTDIGRAAQVSA